MIHLALQSVLPTTCLASAACCLMSRVWGHHQLCRCTTRVFQLTVTFDHQPQGAMLPLSPVNKQQQQQQQQGAVSWRDGGASKGEQAGGVGWGEGDRVQDGSLLSASGGARVAGGGLELFASQLAEAVATPQRQRHAIPHQTLVG